MTHTHRFLTAFVAAILLAFVAPAFAKAHHNNGAQLLGNKVKTNGQHAIHKHGKHAVSVQVTNGKVAGLNVQHSEKGNVPVKKYKTKKKMAQGNGLYYAAFTSIQYQDLGMIYIGYSFVDEYGDEVIYWFPYEMILDGDTGAVEYVPL